MLSLSLYRHALRLYPAFHREPFGDEMIAVFCELQAETATRGMFAQSRFCVRETAGVVAEPCANIGGSWAAGMSGYCFQIGGLRCAPNSVFRRRRPC